jgi:hypothetical protein
MCVRIDELEVLGDPHPNAEGHADNQKDQAQADENNMNTHELFPRENENRRLIRPRDRAAINMAVPGGFPKRR